MIIHIKVKPNSGKQEIEDFGDHRYLVHLKSKPENNEANKELINLFSHYFCLPYARIKIISGMTSDNKVLEIR